MALIEFQHNRFKQEAERQHIMRFTHFNSIKKKEKFRQHWKELRIYLLIKYVTCRVISPLRNTYRVLFSICLSRLNPHVGKIVVDLQYRFRRTRATTNNYSEFFKCM